METELDWEAITKCEGIGRGVVKMGEQERGVSRLETGGGNEMRVIYTAI